MRTKVNMQPELNSQPSNLKLTNEYYRKYEHFSRILDENAKLLDPVHKDLKEPLKYAAVKSRDGSTFKFSSDTVLRILIEQAREIDPRSIGDRRVLRKKVKKLAAKISPKAAKNPQVTAKLKPLYEQLIRLVEGICEWSASVGQRLEAGIRKGGYAYLEQVMAEVIVKDISHYRGLGQRVIDQASRRVLHGAQVPNDEKIFSIFEPHTELLKRGKAGKQIEFGHMIQIQQVQEKFITDYEVFDEKPIEYELLEPAIDSHKKLFGEYPRSVAADKGY